MYFDRFDIVAAYYFYFINYHTGQWSEEYKRLSKILRYFKPCPAWHDISDVSENAMEIYNSIVSRHPKV